MENCFEIIASGGRRKRVPLILCLRKSGRASTPTKIIKAGIGEKRLDLADSYCQIKVKYVYIFNFLPLWK